MAGESRSCVEFIAKLDDPLCRVNCPGCRYYDHAMGRCGDEERVVEVHRKIELARMDREMKGNKGVWLE